MDQIIERYIYDVMRRLPKKEREDIGKELRANIYDMLPENADENEIKTVLYELGSPASLAAKYGLRPRYLISPDIYDEYIRVLKWVSPLVGVIVFAVGLILGAVEAIKNGQTNIAVFMGKTLSNGISLGLTGTFQALVWTTIGFIIAEHAGGKTKNKKQEWKIEDLPEVLPDNKGRIPLSDSITELVLVVIFSVLALSFCTGTLPIAFMIQSGDIQVLNLFSASFLASCIPVIIVMLVVSVSASIIKIKKRRWTPFVCGAVMVSKLINLILFLYLINKPNIFSEEFITYLQGTEWGSFDLLRFVGTDGANPVILGFSIFLIVIYLIESGQAIYKTIKYQD
jgi:hypothetical protein